MMKKASEKGDQERILNLFEQFFDEAQRDHLLAGSQVFRFAVRSLPGIENFYAQLEILLRSWPQLKVSAYRDLKEGLVRISRPAELELSIEQLLQERPLLGLLKKEFESWEKLLRPRQLEDFLTVHYAEVIKSPKTTRRCIEIFLFLIERPADGDWLLPRQLPHSESTKIVGQEPLLLKLFQFWRKQEGTWQDFFRRFRLIRRPPDFRIFAPQLRLQQQGLKNFHGVLSSDWIDQFDFSNLKGTLIVENFETFYALAPEMRTRLLVFGGGWKASLLIDLKSVLPKPLFYWGDLDREGLEILNHLQERWPLITPLLMDSQTFTKYKHLSVKKEIQSRGLRPVSYEPELYEELCRNGLLLEQEKIPVEELRSKMEL